ncbi:hypothetical protein PCE1_000647 [Barthelona sp. PCE]
MSIATKGLVMQVFPEVVADTLHSKGLRLDKRRFADYREIGFRNVVKTDKSTAFAYRSLGIEIFGGLVYTVSKVELSIDSRVELIVLKNGNEINIPSFIVKMLSKWVENTNKMVKYTIEVNIQLLDGNIIYHIVSFLQNLFMNAGVMDVDQEGALQFSGRHFLEQKSLKLMCVSILDSNESRVMLMDPTDKELEMAQSHAFVVADLTDDAKIVYMNLNGGFSLDSIHEMLASE